MLVTHLSLERARIDDESWARWPYTVPCVAALAAGEGLELRAPLTVLVGENGSGKSTLVEGLAEALGLDAQGGRAAGWRYATRGDRTPLGNTLHLGLTGDGYRWMRAPRAKKHGYFLRAETTFGLAQTVSGREGWWKGDLLTMSHGEGFLTIFGEMFDAPGLYLLDEPEAALSFTSCLRLVAVLDYLVGRGSQVVCATHSPILAATPGADLVEVSEGGVRHVSWGQLEVVEHWRSFLGDPRRYLRPLLDQS